MPLPGHRLEPHLVGELIASEIEIRTGRCESFPEAAARIAERRGQRSPSPTRSESASPPRARIRGAPGRSSGSSTRRTTGASTEALRYVAWRNNTFGLHVHVGVRGADRAVAVSTALRSVLPELLALSANTAVRRGPPTRLHSTRMQLFTRSFPRCGVPDAFDGWSEYAGFVELLLRDRLDRREHADLVERAPAPRLRHGRGADLRRPAGRSPSRSPLAALACTRCAARLRRARSTTASRCPPIPARLIEENMWRAIRYGLAGRADRARTGRVRPARAALRGAARVGAPGGRGAGRRVLSRGAGGERSGAADRPLRGGRQPARDLRCRDPRTGAGRVSEGIWVPPGGSADRGREQAAEEQPRPEEEITPEQLAEAIRRMRISELLLSTLSTLAQLGYAKLEPARPRPRAGPAGDRGGARARPGAGGCRAGRDAARLPPGAREPPARVRVRRRRRLSRSKRRGNPGRGGLESQGDGRRRLPQDRRSRGRERRLEAQGGDRGRGVELGRGAIARVTRRRWWRRRGQGADAGLSLYRADEQGLAAARARVRERRAPQAGRADVPQPARRSSTSSS